MIAELETTARCKGQRTEGWYVRTEPLPLDRVIGIDTRAYTAHRWTPFKNTQGVFVLGDIDDNDNIVAASDAMMGVEIGDRVYISRRQMVPVTCFGAVGMGGVSAAYQIGKPLPLEKVLTYHEPQATQSEVA